LSGSEWNEEFHKADLVVKVDDIKRIAPALGPRVVLEEVRDGKHDLTLSEDAARERCLQLLVDWVNAHP